MENKPRGTGTLSKKRYEEITQKFKDIEQDETKVEELLKVLQTVLKFHPEASNYPFYKANLKENETTYHPAKKKYYEANKAEINARRAARKREQVQQARLMSQQQQT